MTQSFVRRMVAVCVKIAVTVSLLWFWFPMFRVLTFTILQTR